MSKFETVMEKEKSTTKEQQNVQLSCSVHPMEIVIAFCETCQKAVCFDCSRESHKDHKCFKMENKAVDARRNIPKVCALIDTRKIPQLQGSLEKIKAQRSQVSNTDNVIEQIHKRANELMALIMEERDLLIEQCKKSAASQTEYYKIEDNVTRRYIDLYKNSLQEAPNIAKSKNDIAVVLFESKINSQVKDFKQRSLLSSLVPVFKAGTTDRSTLNNMLGVVNCDSNFENMNSMLGVPIGIQAKLVSSIRYSCVNVSAICFQDNEMAWLHPAESTVGAVIDVKGTEHKKFDFGLELSDITVTDTNVILATETRKMRILQITSNGVVKELFSTAPLQPHGIFACQNGDLLVTQMYKADPKAVDSKRLVHRLGKEYVKKVTIQYTDSFFKKKQILTHPRRVAENGNGDIIVIDLLGENTGRVCVFDFVGKMRYVYEGNPHRSKFLPFDLCCESDLRIFVSDYYNHEINVISYDGQYIQEIQTHSEGLLNPIALALDKKGRIWIGGKGGKIIVYKYW